MDDQAEIDLKSIRQAIGHLHTLSIEQHKRLKEVERHVRDIKAGVVVLLVGVVAILYEMIRRAS